MKKIFYLNFVCKLFKPMMVNKGFNTDEFYNKILFESDNFKVIPSLGSLVEGWLLVIPKEHYISYGEITDSMLLSELEKLISDVCKIVKNEYGDYIIFEHGPVIEKSFVGCGVDYAHIHIVPINLTLNKIIELSDQNIEWHSADNIKATSNYINKGQPYLYFKDNLNNSYIGTSSQIPSQFFRRIISKLIGKPEMFNWKDYLFLNNVTNTYKKLEGKSNINKFYKPFVYA